MIAEGIALATRGGVRRRRADPVEGTILSVARPPRSRRPTAAEEPEDRLGDVRARRRARRPGGAGPDARAAAAAARRRRRRRRRPRAVRHPRRRRVRDHRPASRLGAPPGGQPGRSRSRTLPTGDLTEDGPAYEVMYLLDGRGRGASPALRLALAPLGDSLVVVGGEGLWNVHVHVDDVGAAVEVGIRAGTPRRIRGHPLRRAGRPRPRAACRAPRPRAGRWSPRDRASSRSSARPVPQVLDGGPGRRPSTGADPGGDRGHRCRGGRRAAQRPGLGRRRRGRRARGGGAAASTSWSIPTRAQVQGIAALAVHEPGRPLDTDVVQMTAAARGARHGAVTVAAKQAMTTAGPCEPGDVLGVVQGDFAIVGEDLFEVATGVLERLLGGGGELVTLVAGEEAGDLVERVRALGRARTTRSRRRGLRGRAGALPAAGGGGVAVVQVTWDSPVAAVGGKHAGKIVKATGCRDGRRPARHYPRTYVRKGTLSELGDLAEGDLLSLVGEVVCASRRPTRTSAPASDVPPRGPRPGRGRQPRADLLRQGQAHRRLAGAPGARARPGRHVLRPAEVVQQPLGADQPRLPDVRARATRTPSPRCPT